MSAAPIPQDDPLKDARFDVEEGVDGLVRIAGQKQHMIEAMRWLRDYRKQAAALAASEARVAALEEMMEQQEEQWLLTAAELDEARRHGGRFVLRAEAAEQSLAEALPDALRYRWLRNKPTPGSAYIAASVGGEWCQVRESAADAAIDALLPKSEGATS